MAPGDKRRRKKARISYSSSESESEASDSQNSVHSEPSELSELSDAEIDEPEIADKHPRELLHNPSPASTSEFNQHFLHLVTAQFGEELAQLREANDFTGASLTQLVAGLKQGIDIFTPEQQRRL